MGKSVPTHSSVKKFIEPGNQSDHNNNNNNIDNNNINIYIKCTANGVCRTNLEGND